MNCKNCRNGKRCSRCNEFCQEKPLVQLDRPKLSDGPDILGYAPRAICSCEMVLINFGG